MKNILQVLVLVIILMSTACAEINEYKNFCDIKNKLEILSLEKFTQECKEAKEFYIQGLSSYARGEYKTSVKQLQKSLFFQEKVFVSTAFSIIDINEKLVMVYEAMGDYSSAEESQNKIFEIKVEIYGKGSDEIKLALADVMAKEYMSTETSQVLGINLAVGEDLKKKLGKEHSQVAVLYSNVVDIFQREALYENALEGIQKVITINEKAFSHNSEEVAKNYVTLANIYKSIANYYEALSCLNKASIINSKIHGIKSLEVAKNYRNIGDVYKELAEYDKALQYYEKALFIDEELLGKEHPETVFVYNDLFSLSLLTQNYSEGIQYYKIVERVLSANLILGHPEFIKAFINKYELLIRTEVHSNIKDLALLVRLVKALGDDYLYASTNYARLSFLFKEMADYPNAVIYLEKALAINEKRFLEGHPFIAENYSDLASIYFTTSEYKKSLEYYKKALKMNEKLFTQEHPKVAKNYSALGDLYDKCAEYPMALESYEKALSINEKVFTKEHPSIAENYAQIADYYSFMSEYDKALEYYEKALLINKKVFGEQHTVVADNYLSMGSAYFSRSDIYQQPKALEYFSKAMDILKKKFGIYHTSSLDAISDLVKLSKVGGIKLRKIEEVEKLILDSKIKTPTMVNVYIKLAGRYYEASEYTRALEHYQRAVKLNILLFGNTHIDTAYLYRLIANVHRELGDDEQAKKYYEDGLLIAQNIVGNEHPLIAGIYSSIAGMYLSQGDGDRALEYYTLAETALENRLGKEHLFTAIIYSNISKFYFSLSKAYQDEVLNQRVALLSIMYSQKALDAFPNTYTLSKPEYLSLIINAININFYMKDYKNALYYNNLVMFWRKKILGKNHDLTAYSYRKASHIYLDMKDYVSAYEYAKKAYDIFLTNRDKNFKSLSNQQKKQYLNSNINQISLLLETAYQYSNKSNQSEAINKQELSKTALTYWLNYKGSILDSENSISTLYEQTKDKKVKEMIETLRDKKMHLAKLSQQYPSIEQAKAHQENIKQTKNKIDELERELSSKVESFKEEMNLRVLTLDNVAKYLKPNELYIDYAKAGDNYYLFTLNSKKDVTFTQIDSNDTKIIESSVQEFRDQTKYMSDNLSIIKDKEIENLKTLSTANLSKLYKLVIDKPIGKTIKSYSSLIISPDGALSLLPFESLYNEKTKHYIIQDKAIRYIPSGKEFVRLNRRAEQSNEDVVVFANPDFHLELPKDIKSVDIERLITPNTKTRGIDLDPNNITQLNGSKEEADFIKNKYKKRAILFTKKIATESNLLKIQEPKILHLSTHGYFLNDNSIINPMLKSGILLSGAWRTFARQEDGGVISSLRLSGLNLKGTELVMLSACETGVSDISNGGEGVSGLNKAFLQAGASDVAMTLWSVADKETANLIKEFYNNTKDKNYSKALRTAKLEFINNKDSRKSHPYFWAAFIISGK